MLNLFTNYHEKHPVVALITAPIAGGLFLMFLPAVGFYLTGKAIFQMGCRCIKAVRLALA